MQSVLVFAVWAWLLALFAAPSAKETDPVSEELIKEKLFRYSMQLADAMEMVASDEDSWEIAYQVTTPSTSDIACRWVEGVYFSAKFFKGSCYYLEKRAELPQDLVESVFRFYTEKLGPSPEAAQSSNGKLVFARWELDKREISLTAFKRENGLYAITVEDFAPEVIGRARHIQEQELEVMQEEDPLRGGTSP